VQDSDDLNDVVSGTIDQQKWRARDYYFPGARDPPHSAEAGLRRKNFSRAQNLIKNAVRGSNIISPDIVVNCR
jgi:hypothetical protein